MCADVVIVGGGPVGCWTALQIKKRNPGLDVQIYERNPEYQRDHMLSISRRSLLRHGAYNEDSALFTQISAAHSTPPETADKAGNAGELRRVTYIRTLDFESLLKEQCAGLGIGFTYAKIESPEDAARRHPECRVFIAADGAHSRMRTALLGEDAVEKNDMFPTIDVQYKTLGQAKYMRHPTFNETNNIVIESIECKKNGVTPVALRFLVDQKTFDAMPEASFKKPLTLEEAGPFAKEIESFQNLRRRHDGELKVKGTEKITKIMLSRYASKKFAVKADSPAHEAAWFIVGDAAMGMPFYRSVNAGLLLGSQLGGILADGAVSLDAKVDAYNGLRDGTVAREFRGIAAKQKGVLFYKDSVRPKLRAVAKSRAGRIVTGLVTLPVIGIASLINPKARAM